MLGVGEVGEALFGQAQLICFKATPNHLALNPNTGKIHFRWHVSDPFRLVGFACPTFLRAWAGWNADIS